VEEQICSSTGGGFNPEGQIPKIGILAKKQKAPNWLTGAPNYPHGKCS
jgi:hypothetical protein